MSDSEWGPVPEPDPELLASVRRMVGSEDMTATAFSAGTVLGIVGAARTLVLHATESPGMSPQGAALLLSVARVLDQVMENIAQEVGAFLTIAKERERGPALDDAPARSPSSGE